MKLDVFKKTFRKKAYKSNVKIDIPDGLFIKCTECEETIFQKDNEYNLHVCPKCGKHFRINSRERIRMTVDQNSFTELFQDVISTNPLNFPGYTEKVEKYQTKTEQNEALVCGECTIAENRAVVAVLDSFFMMGSMGSVVGEKLTRSIEYATKHQLPLIVFSASGGARMQEGILSLMQMAKTSAAISRHHDKGLLYISVLTHPTTGGVAASFAMLGDIILAEPGSLIGFAGQRVIKQTINQDLPEGFQSAEFQLDKGFIDKIVKRNEMKDTLSKLLSFHNRGDKHDKPNK
nr:acetyl-CoA carboxylase, carboxyltransferase subunit beta [Haloplasma contractile]